MTSDMLGWRRRVYRKVLCWAYSQAELVTANSQDSVQVLRQMFPHKRVRWLNNVIDVDRVCERAALVDPVPALEGPYLLGVGRLHYQKGFDVLLRAAALLAPQRRLPVVLVGSGPEELRLRALAKEAGIAEDVRFIGELRNPFPLMKGATAVVLPSRWEGFPNVPLEALSLGVPVVCSDCRSGPRELLQDGRWGRLVPPEDVVRLAEAITLLLGDLEGERLRARQASVWIRRKFTAARAVDIVLSTVAS